MSLGGFFQSGDYNKGCGPGAAVGFELVLILCETRYSMVFYVFIDKTYFFQSMFFSFRFTSFLCIEAVWPLRFWLKDVSNVFPKIYVFVV